jgi:hypothetical protein
MRSTGHPRGGDLHYVRSTDDGATFSPPQRCSQSARPRTDWLRLTAAGTAG